MSKICKNFMPAGLEDDGDDWDDGFGFSAYVPNASESSNSNLNGFVNEPLFERVDISTLSNNKPSIFPSNFTIESELEALDECEDQVNIWTKGPIEFEPVRSTDSKQTSLLLIDDLRVSVKRGNIDVIKKFLDCGVEVDMKFRNGWTPLMYAAKYAVPDVVAFLLDRRADPNFAKDGFNVMLAACTSPCTNESKIISCIEQLLAAGASVTNLHYKNMTTPLMFACSTGRASRAKKLLDYGVGIDEQDSMGRTSLILACENGHANCVKVLLEAGADTEKQKSTGSRAVDIAAFFDNKQIVQLLENGPANDDGAANEEDGADTSESNACKRFMYDEFELFLSGIDLRQLISLFRDKNVSFKDFLRFTNQDLIEIGVDQLGFRKKIINNLKEVHKKNWEASSLMTLEYNKKITCSDTSTMVANINVQSSYVASTVGYIRDHIEADNDVLLKTADEGAGGVQDLCLNTEEAITNVRHLHQELTLLRTRLNKICRYHDFTEPDLVVHSPAEVHLKSRWTVFLLTVVPLALGLTAIWRRKDSILLIGLDLVGLKSPS